MNEITRQIEEIFKELDILKNNTYKIKIFLSMLVGIILSILIPFLIYPLFPSLHGVEKIINPVYLLISGIIFILILYGYLIPQKKLELLKYGIIQDKSIFSGWANANYYKYRSNLFFQKLLSAYLLKDKESDIQLLDLYINQFKSEFENDHYILNLVKIVGVLSLALGIPIWSKYLDFTFSEKSLNNNFKLWILSFEVAILIAFVIVFVTVYVRQGIFGIFEIRKRRLKRITVELENLKLKLLVNNL